MDFMIRFLCPIGSMFKMLVNSTSQISRTLLTEPWKVKVTAKIYFWSLQRMAIQHNCELTHPAADEFVEIFAEVDGFQPLLHRPRNWTVLENLQIFLDRLEKLPEEDRVKFW